MRFAPSPTGFLHVGSVRTALYNWLLARHAGGTFVLRIEDTDEARDREEWVAGIQSCLRWVGLDWDEGPYRSSRRAHRYAEAADKLVAAGHAYWCGCTRDDVVGRAGAGEGALGYDGHCRDRGLGPGPGRALRFRTPDQGATVVHDVVRGQPRFDHSAIEDFVIVRSSGRAVFVLANVVDDLDMAITHVVRAEEHLPTTPKYVLVWEALGGGEVPVFAHAPTIVNAARQKLSKRRDPVALEHYRDEGFLPEVLLNYLALLGWSPPDGRERLTVAEMVAAFRLEDIGTSPAFFDLAKLRAFNGDALRALPTTDFVAAARPFLERGPWERGRFDPDAFAPLAPLVQTRVATLAEVPGMVDFVFLDEPVVDDASWRRAMAGDAPAVLDGAIAAFEEVGEWVHRPEVDEPLRRALVGVGEGLGLSLRKAQAPVRVAVTGRSVGPPLFESLAVLGRERTLRRLRAARARV